jgi:DNA mismatch repair protein MutS2
LVLLDEVGTGTDPAQGSALAQAVLEELVAAGARVVTTTHYSRVKELAVADPRFRIAAMEYVHHRPTYALRVGSIGESFALEAAKRMKLPAAVLFRADALLGDESRRLLALQIRLQEETDKARQAQSEHEEKLALLSDRERKIEAARQEAAELIKCIREDKTAQYLLDIRDKERELEEIMVQARSLLTEQTTAQAEAKSKKASLRAQVEQGNVQQTLQELRDTIKAEKHVAERSVIASAASSQYKATPLAPGQPVEVGTELMVLEPGNMLRGSKGVVTHRNKGRGRVVIRIAGVEIKMDRHLLGMPEPRWKFDALNQ